MGIRGGMGFGCGTVGWVWGKGGNWRASPVSTCRADMPGVEGRERGAGAPQAVCRRR